MEATDSRISGAASQNGGTTKFRSLACIAMLTTLWQACVYEKISPATDCEGIDIDFNVTISPIIQSNCAISNCHNGSQFPDFREPDEIRQNAQRIKIQVAKRTMPPDGSLPQEQIDAITCWTDNGTAEN